MTHLVISKLISIDTIRHTAEINDKTIEMSGSFSNSNRFAVSKFICDILTAANPNMYINFVHTADKDNLIKSTNLIIGERRIKIQCELNYENYDSVTDICNLLRELNYKLRETVLNTERYSSDEIYL
jgi:hypothetical protein